MEDDKKKRKNRKRKNKQGQSQQTSNEVTTAEETALQEQNDIDITHNDHAQHSEMSDKDAELDQNGEAKSTTALVLEVDIRQLEAEKQCWLQREKFLQEERNRVIVEKQSWVLKEANLEEKIRLLEIEKDSYTQNENSAKEVIARLNETNAALQAQVNHFEDSNSALLKENQQMVEKVSQLEARIAHLENERSDSSITLTKKDASQDEDSSSLVESARALVEKLLIENAELVEKINEPYLELDRQNATAAHSLVARSSPHLGEHVAQPQAAHEVFVGSLLDVEKNGSVETIEENSFAPDGDVASIATTEAVLEESLLETSDNSEIVPVSLDEIQEVSEPVAETHEHEEVPLTDAPLIGAPFRFISFVARYVSGADLVETR